MTRKEDPPFRHPREVYSSANIVSTVKNTFSKAINNIKIMRNSQSSGGDKI